MARRQDGGLEWASRNGSKSALQELCHRLHSRFYGCEDLSVAMCRGFSARWPSVMVPVTKLRL